MMNNLIITPKTKIHDLLEAYPQLEAVLISIAPPFKKLQNPLLRRTIAKVTTLNQAAVIGGLKVEELVNTLRQEVGQAMADNINAEENNYVTEQPGWFEGAEISSTIDIREMLHAGEQPVHEVLAHLKQLKPGVVLKVDAPFIPAPLIDKSLSLNYEHWLQKTEDGCIIYFKA